MADFAPRAESIFDPMRRRPVGILLDCPDCPPVLGSALRVEVAADFRADQPLPDLVAQPGPLGFIVRCDQCGFRVAMRGDRLPTVAMIEGDS